MFYSGFDELLPEAQRESAKGDSGLFPTNLRAEIESMNDWVYNTVNNGVYKCGFASTQEAYESHVFPLFESLDRLEKHLSDSAHQPYLFGTHITEADIRLYTTMIRFDVAYHSIFRCNLRMIRHDYPNIHKWLRTLYWKGPTVFQSSVKFETVGSSFFLVVSC
jgi:putative glutathione S-transferase